MSARTAFAIVGAAGCAMVAVLIFWHWIVGAAVIYVGYRVVTRHVRAGRRRPRSSWAKLIEAGSLAVVAWNTRGISGGRARVTPGFTLGLGRRLRRNEQDDDTVPF